MFRAARRNGSQRHVAHPGRSLVLGARDASPSARERVCGPPLAAGLSDDALCLLTMNESRRRPLLPPFASENDSTGSRAGDDQEKRCPSSRFERRRCPCRVKQEEAMPIAFRSRRRTLPPDRRDVPGSEPEDADRAWAARRSHSDAAPRGGWWWWPRCGAAHRSKTRGANSVNRTDGVSCSSGLLEGAVGHPAASSPGVATTPATAAVPHTHRWSFIRDCEAARRCGCRRKFEYARRIAPLAAARRTGRGSSSPTRRRRRRRRCRSCSAPTSTDVRVLAPCGRRRCVLCALAIPHTAAPPPSRPPSDGRRHQRLCAAASLDHRLTSVVRHDE